MANLAWPGNFKGPEALIAVAQNLTAAWADLGTPQSVKGASKIGLWLTVDINDSNNPRVRLLAIHTSGGSEFTVPIRTVGASAVLVEPEYIEFNVDEDRLMLLSWDLDRLVDSVQFQVMVSAVGASAGQIDTAHVTTSV